MAPGLRIGNDDGDETMKTKTSVTGPGRPRGPATKVLYARVPLDLHAAIKANADEKGQNVNVWILRALKDSIERMSI